MSHFLTSDLVIISMTLHHLVSLSLLSSSPLLSLYLCLLLYTVCICGTSIGVLIVSPFVCE